MDPTEENKGKLAGDIEVRERNPMLLENNSHSTDEEEEDEEEEEKMSKCCSDSAAKDWAVLMEPLLLSILCRLDTLEAFFAFRGVCRNWRSLAAPTPASLPSQNPLILLARCYTEIFYDIVRHRLYKLEPPWQLFSRFSIGYSHGFVVSTAEPRPGSVKPLLWNVFTDAKIWLPEARHFDRAIFSSNPSSSDCLAILFSSFESSIQYCHIGDSRWEKNRNGIYSNINWTIVEDLIFLKGKLYALTNTHRLAEVDLFPHPKWTLLTAENTAKVGSTPGRFWLVECSGELLMVHVSRKMGFNVYRWVFENGRWVEASSLDGRALFMGSRGFAASIVPACSEVRKNCIYYAGHRRDRWFVFSLSERTLEPVPAVSSGLLRGQTLVPPVWVFPSLC